MASYEVQRNNEDVGMRKYIAYKVNKGQENSQFEDPENWIGAATEFFEQFRQQMTRE